MRALIAGASGFIGSALSASLRSDGHEVLSLGRPGSGPDASIDLATRTLDLSAIGGDLSEVDVVFQLLGSPLTPRRWSASKVEAIRASRIASTDLIARSIAASERPPVFVVGTAIGIYGNRGEELLDEQSSAGEGFLAELCRAWEAAAAPARSAGGRVVFGRTGVVLGRKGGLLAAQLPLFRLGLGARLGNGRQWTSWISLDDEVRALRLLAESDTAQGAYNLVAPEPVRNRELTAAIAAAVKRRARLSVPRPVLLALFGRRTYEELAMASTRVGARRLLELGFTFRYGDLTSALEVAVSS